MKISLERLGDGGHETRNMFCSKKGAKNRSQKAHNMIERLGVWLKSEG